MGKSAIEFQLGEFLTFAGVLDGSIRLIDNYSRWEVVLSLQRYVGFLGNPAIPFFLLIAGLILIHRSMLAKVTEAQQSVLLHDADGRPIIHAVTAPSVSITVGVAFVAMILAVTCCLLWLRKYNPSPPLLANKIVVPPICLTADCYPQTRVQRPVQAAQTNAITAPINQGPCGVIQNGGSNNIASPNCLPPQRHLTKAQQVQLSESIKSSPLDIIVWVPVSDHEAWVFSDDICDALRTARWRIVDGHAQASIPGDRDFSDMVVFLNPEDAHDQNGQLYVNDNVLVVSRLVTQLRSFGFSVAVGTSTKVPKNVVKLVIGAT